MSHAQTFLLEPPKIEYDFGVEEKKLPHPHAIQKPASAVWTEEEWDMFDSEIREKCLRAVSEESALSILIRAARKVLRTYSSSFFIVTRFLPSVKRDAVELVYAAVRYPDEIVDSFPLAPHQRTEKLQTW